MTRQDDNDRPLETNGIPTGYEQLPVSESGLDWGDISQIRDRLEMTPTERLKAAQDFMNSVIAIRAQNGDRAPV